MPYPLKKVSEIFKIKSGNFLPKKSMKENGDFFVFGGNGINGKHDEYNLYGDNIIIGRVGALCGNVRFVNEKLWLTDNAFYISEYLLEVDKKYLSIFLSFLNLGKTSNSSAQPVISYKSIQNLKIPLPPLPTQKAIVQKLDTAFEKIDASIGLAQKNLANIEELGRSILSETSQYEKVKICEIVKELSAGGDLPKDKSFSKEKTEEYQIPIYANAIKEDGLYGYTHTAKIFKPAITVSARGTIGFTKLRTEPFYPIVRLLVLIPKPEKATLQYLEYIINTINLKQFGSSIPQLSVPQLKNFEIPLPPLEKQKEIVEHLDRVFEGNKRLKESYEEKLRSLQEMKQSLLKEAFEGRLIKD